MHFNLYYFIKLFLAALIIVVVTEVAKINAYIGGFIKSLPLISLITLIWVYLETHSNDKIISLSISTFWFVLPTLPMFLLLPFLLKEGINFYVSLVLSILAMIACYWLTIIVLKNFGYRL
jgi:hypothetical protein